MPAHAYGIARHNPDAINLHAYPALTHAPTQWGEGIRFASNGKPVEDVMPISGQIVEGLDAIAERLGVSFGDACDALKYLRDQKAI